MLSSLCLGLGLFLPCMTMVPSMGFDPLDTILGLEPQTKSILGGIVHFFGEGDYFIGLILLVFSVLFPIWKHCVYYEAIQRAQAGRPHSKAMKYADKLGKFSMLDVIVIGMLVLAFQTFPGGTRIEIEYGIAFFFVSVILSMLISIKLKEIDETAP